MKIYKKALLAFIAIIIAYFVYLAFVFGAFPMSQSSIKRDFNKNYKEIDYIAKCLCKSEFEDVYIPSGSERMFEDIDSFAQGSDAAEIKDSVRKLFSKGYNVIIKDAEYDYILFQRWSNRDAGRGVIYSRSGIVPKEEATTLIPWI